MIRVPCLFVSALVALCCAASLSAAPVIHMIGDSTMADKPRLELPERGWGQLFRTIVREPAKVVNHAANGRSTRSFIHEGRWRKVVGSLKTGDWVVIQFGHNDEKVDKPGVGAEARGLYQDNLRKFVRESVSHGAHPVLATSVARRRWNEQGELVPTHGEYPEVVRMVAREEDVPLVDMERLTNELERSMGVEGSKKLHLWFAPGEHPKLPKGLEDDTHYSEFGALRVAKLFAAECQRLHIGIADWVDGASLGEKQEIRPLTR